VDRAGGWVQFQAVNHRLGPEVKAETADRRLSPQAGASFAWGAGRYPRVLPETRWAPFREARFAD
jgi:hypothetical protein